LRVLFVDDELTVRRIVAEYLEDEGHIVTTAEDGQEGLTLFKTGLWDLVMTDRVMPRLSGDGLAAEIKRINPKMPVMLVTAFADRPPDPEKKGSPFDLVIRKPFTRETLRAAIALVMS
jgi:CheY-like chemotaxis protein